MTQDKTKQTMWLPHPPASMTKTLFHGCSLTTELIPLWAHPTTFPNSWDTSHDCYSQLPVHTTKVPVIHAATSATWLQASLPAATDSSRHSLTHLGVYIQYASKKSLRNGLLSDQIQCWSVSSTMTLLLFSPDLLHTGFWPDLLWCLLQLCLHFCRIVLFCMTLQY